MIKKYFEEFDETLYEETLDNGLKVSIIYKKESSSSTVCFGTPYGSLNINQEIDGKVYNFHPGIAHFLEHKLFESKGDDIMNAFTKLGANVNAFTSYQETVYFFSKSGGEIDECLKLLLDFVQNLDITEESVEKEKGIILEELAMYKQNPDTVLMNETFKSLYKHFPLNIDIGGDEASVSKITKQELEDCYKFNYHPSKMKLVIVTYQDPIKLIELIKENQAAKTFNKPSVIVSANEKEPLEVAKPSSVVTLPINKDKVAIAYKFDTEFENSEQAQLASFALRLYYNAYFSKANDNYQNWLDQKLINDYFSYDIEVAKEFGYLMFYNETNNKDAFNLMINNELQKDLFNEESLALQKRRIIGALFKSFDDNDGLAILLTRYLLSDVDLFKLISDIQSISLNDVFNYVSAYKLEHKTVIHLKSRS